MELKLTSGFAFDYGNLFGEGKVTAADLEEYAPAIRQAHAAVTRMRQTGLVRGHLSKDGAPEPVLFPQLPYVSPEHLNSPASMAHLEELSRWARDEADAVVSLGIGGSYLGNKVIFDVHCGEFWNLQTREQRGGWPEIYFSGNNIDPRRTGDLICHLAHKAQVTKTHAKRPFTILLLVISKSGGTLDTMSNFMVLYEALTQTKNVRVQVAAVTDPDEEHPTLLKKLAIEKGWPTYQVPDGIGGRFSVFCDVGLTLAACIGFDIPEFLRGAREMDEACQTENIWQNPAMLNAALKFIAGEKYGRDLEVMMPYGDYLKSFSEWYIQLLAESLGKQYDREGREVCYGRTPLVAVGTTDMHAQTQQHQEGKLNKIVQFIRVEQWPEDRMIPNVFPEAAPLAAISGVTMAQALEAARQSNAEALTANHRFNALFSLPELSAYHLGALMYMLSLSVAYEGELADVDAFNQPGVEAYKKLMGPRLAALKH